MEEILRGVVVVVEQGKENPGTLQLSAEVHLHCGKGAVATKRRASDARGKARLELRLGCNLCQHHHHTRRRRITRARPSCTAIHHGSRPSAAADMADAAARPQWACPPGAEFAIPAAHRTSIPHTPNALRRIRDTLNTAALVPVARRHLGGHPQGGPEEEDVISQEATTVHGRQRTERHHGAQQVLGVWEGQAGAYPVPLLC